MNSRLIKIFFSAAIGLYMLLICFNNIFDYSSNFPFINMVATMEDTFSKEKNGWRAINSVALHQILFILIIAWELSIAGFVWLGTFSMIGKFHCTFTKFTYHAESAEPYKNGNK